MFKDIIISYHDLVLKWKNNEKLQSIFSKIKAWSPESLTDIEKRRYIEIREKKLLPNSEERVLFNRIYVHETSRPIKQQMFRCFVSSPYDFE